MEPPAHADTGAPAAMATTVRGDGCDACASKVRQRLASQRRLPQPQIFVPASGSDSIASSSSLMLFSRSGSQTPSCQNLDPNPPVAHFPLPVERISEVPRTACLHGRDASLVWPPPERSDEVQVSMLLLSPSGFREPCLLLAGAGLTEHVQPWPGGLKVLTSQGGS